MEANLPRGRRAVVTANRERGMDAPSPGHRPARVLYVAQVTDPPDAQPCEPLTVAYSCTRCARTFYGGEYWHPICRPCWEELRRR